MGQGRGFSFLERGDKGLKKAGDFWSFPRGGLSTGHISGEERIGDPGVSKGNFPLGEYFIWGEVSLLTGQGKGGKGFLWGIVAGPGFWGPKRVVFFKTFLYWGRRKKKGFPAVCWPLVFWGVKNSPGSRGFHKLPQGALKENGGKNWRITGDIPLFLLVKAPGKGARRPHLGKGGEKKRAGGKTRNTPCCPKFPCEKNPFPVWPLNAGL